MTENRKYLRKTVAASALTSLLSLSALPQTTANSDPIFTDHNNRPTILVAISVSWEGMHLKNHNIEAVKSFTARYPSIPVTHFIDAGYFHHPLHRERMQDIAKSLLRPGDQLGLKVSPTKTLTQAAGIVFRRSPTFWGADLTAQDCQIDCGHDVPLSIYRLDEIRRLFAHSLQEFSTFGLPKPNIYRANGWMATQNILQVLAENKITYDFSAVDPSLLATELQNYPLYAWLQNLWHQLTPYTAPYQIQTQSGAVTELGNAGLMVDYQTSEQIKEIFQSYIHLAETQPNQKLIFHLGLHQETAAKFLPRLEKSLAAIFALAKAEEINILVKALGE